MSNASRGAKVSSLSGTAGYEEVINGKKRKVWRALNMTGSSSAVGTATTATMMTPEAAANYLQQAAALSTGASGESVQITFPNGIAATTTGITMDGASFGAALGGSHRGSSASVSFGNLDFAALAKAGDLSALTTAAARNAPSLACTAGIGGDERKNKSGKDSLPCSEAEMKALMSMFVEIMGMSLDTDKLSQSTTSKKMTACKKSGNGSSMFRFGGGKNGPPSSGWPDPAIAAATGDLDALNTHRNHYSDEDDEDDSLPDLEDMKEVMSQQQNQHKSNSPSSVLMESIAAAAAAAPTITGLKGVAPVEWESLEQVAIEDAMEAEERARKAAKRREKKYRKKDKARKEAATKAAEDAAKKNEKAILAWRSRVVSACQSNELDKLESLIEDSPLRNNGDNSTASTNQQSSSDDAQSSLRSISPHLEFLLPHIVAKNRQLAERGQESRAKLAQFVFSTHLPIVFTLPLRSGRTALHTACFHGELEFVQDALERAANWKSPTPNDDSVATRLTPSYVNVTCQESGFAPIHYAVLSGSNAVFETLLKAGADVKTRSSDTLTWRASNGKGITARELAESLVAGQQDREIETHGVAMEEAVSVENRWKFVRLLERMVNRLNDVEQNGYSPPPPEEEDLDTETQSEGSGYAHLNVLCIDDDESPEGDLDGEPEIVELKPSELSSVSSSNNDKAKKKKKKKKTESQPDKEQHGKVGIYAENQDPLISALLGMGFTDEQITASVRACGGTDRATADDLVVWMLSQGVESNVEAPAPAVRPSPPTKVRPPTTKPKAKAPDVEMRAKDAKRVEHAAKTEDEARLAAQRLAAKREETRRRNREWNNRAQARQIEQEQAKIAQAMTQASRTANQRAAAGPVQQQALQVQSAAAPQEVLAPSPTYLAAHSASTGPVASVVSAHPGGAAMGMPPPGTYNLQMPTTAAETGHNPNSGTNRFVEQQPPMPVSRDHGTGGHLVVQPSWEPPSSQSSLYPEASSHYASLSVADDSTVSSYGSGRVAAPTTFSSSTPPGFRTTAPPAALSPQAEEVTAARCYELDENPLGEMRATAREFVPTAFKSPASMPARNSHTLRPAVSLPPSSSIVMPSTAVMNPPEPPMSSRLRAFSGAEFGTGSGPNLIMHPSGPALLMGLRGPVTFPPPLLSPVSQHLAAPFDRLTTVTHSSEQQSPVVKNAGSSVTGLSASEEPHMPGGVLETITSGLSSSSFDGNAAGSTTAIMRGGTSIWGGIGGGTDGDTNPAPNTVAGIPLSGSFSISNNSSGVNRAFAPRSDGAIGQTAMESGFGPVGGWGAPSVNRGSTSQSRGSIW